MARYQIAHATSADYNISIFAENDSAPDEVFNFIIQNVSQYAGINDLDVPLGHLPNEYQVTIIDVDNSVFKALQSTSYTRPQIEITKESNTFLGEIELDNSNFKFTNHTNVITLICSDGLTRLKNNTTVAADCVQFMTINDIITTIFSNLYDQYLNIYINIGIFFQKADGDQNDSAINLKLNLQALTRSLSDPNDYKILMKICEDFELCLFKENMSIYILSSYARSSNISSLYNTQLNYGIGQKINVSYSKILSESNYRHIPYVYTKHYGGAITTNEIQDTKSGVDNPNLNISDYQYPSGGYRPPMGWCYSDNSRFSVIQNEFRATSTSNSILYQFLTGPYYNSVNIKLKGEVALTDASSTNVSFRLLRAKIIQRSDSNNPADYYNGNFTPDYTYETDFHGGTNIPFDVDETVGIGPLWGTLYVEMYVEVADVDQNGTTPEIGSVRFQHFELSQANNSIGQKLSYYSFPGQNRLLRNSNLSDQRRHYGIGDMQYLSGSQWLPTYINNNGYSWGVGRPIFGFGSGASDFNNASKDHVITTIRDTIWRGGIRIFELPISKFQNINLHDEVEITYNGEQINCIPIRIKTSSDSNTTNLVRLIECQDPGYLNTSIRDTRDYPL